ncbi:TetR/AcrR family transcriptional regulator [Mesorhizobium xinjiangense]|uniref:TetR/AcrR family transcriptional regulator n=1 Tax=Mesorhizobium xinjiangense TaxID=2678685 RepID=UPI001F310F2C|nr:TetR/AcrR family transcriptional regulator [Mesorhizobium xinjiangense]
MGEDTTTRNPGRPRRPETDDAILSAALGLFIAHGIGGVSFEAVARKAGVTRATIYRRWSDREDMIARALGRLKEKAEAPVGRWEEMPFETLVQMMVEHGPKGWVDYDARRLLARIIGSQPDAPRLLDVFWDVYGEPRRAAFSAIVERARKEGHLPPETDPDLFQAMMSGAIMYRLLLIPGEDGEDELRAYFVGILRQLGLGEILDRSGRAD